MLLKLEEGDVEALKILVLESGEFSENVFRDLEELDFEVYIAQDSMAALQLYQEQEFFCAILELKAPLVDILLLEKMMSDIPTIIVSENDDEQSYKRAKGLGAVDFLSKPYCKDDFIYLVENLVEDYREDAA